MLQQNRCWLSGIAVAGLVLAGLTCRPATAQEVAELIPEYESYAEADFVSASRGTVKAKMLGSKGWYLAIEAPPGESPSRVTLNAKDQKVLRLLALRGGGRRLVQKGDSIDVIVPADGVGWFFLYAPFPDVSVYDYQPKTLFKLADNTPAKAKYPVVDIHVHLALASPEERLKIMDAVGVALVIDSPLGTATEFSYRRFEEKYPDRFLTFGNVNFSTRFDEEFPGDVIAKLESDASSMGVPGVSEVIDKGSGVYGHALVPEPRGNVYVDDDRMMPLWRSAARLKLPVLLHVAEPIWFYEPIDGDHEFLRSQAFGFRWSLAGTDVLSRDEMMRRRDRIMEEIPDLVVIGAHMGHLEDDLARLGETLDKHPNFYVEMGVRHAYLGVQPHTARKFHIKYQDRILFGQDGALNAWQYRQYFRFMETDDDQIAIRFWEPKLYGLNLPDEVLKKIYYGNAARLFPKVKDKLLKLHPDLDFPE